jgi:hypothetical protein
MGRNKKQAPPKQLLTPYQLVGMFLYWTQMADRSAPEPKMCRTKRALAYGHSPRRDPDHLLRRWHRLSLPEHRQFRAPARQVAPPAAH